MKTYFKSMQTNCLGQQKEYWKWTVGNDTGLIQVSASYDTSDHMRDNWAPSSSWDRANQTAFQQLFLIPEMNVTILTQNISMRQPHFFLFYPKYSVYIKCLSKQYLSLYKKRLQYWPESWLYCMNKFSLVSCHCLFFFLQFPVSLDSM